MKVSLLLLLPLVSSYVISARHKHPVEPQDDVVGVGIHFSMSYATAAVRYESGKVENLVMLDADANYIRSMARWADGESKRRCDTLWGKLQCSTAQVLRWSKKRLGLPATTDVGALAAFLQQVKTEVETSLEVKAEKKGHPGAIEVSNILPIFPTLPALEEEDIQDALEYVGLDWVPAVRQSSQFYHETNAAFAGLGNGLCKSWKDARECAKQEAAMMTEHILFLKFDDVSFSATLQYMQTAYHQQGIYAQALDMAHGRDALPVYEIARAKFWARIHEVIVDVAGALQKPPNKIVMMGMFGTDLEFVEVVKAALWEVLEFDVSQLVYANSRTMSRMSAARGAAEFAARSQHWRKSGRKTEESDIPEL
ncbi:hypothetical protein K505DRAFT_327898 [Melanomma pulvis-pyrius CBS 109.77]|uniref:Uncharacterized protein n=1 Tax=Melanomma pulvis-pyrius CBS 109.77 TaxID=1314802 RepID=A0A6A6X1C4_9PLEO|nr:hypothetical protein K505DRAFT_327898 [Melanomma pulvis-pyrius CBS 109.77]